MTLSRATVCDTRKECGKFSHLTECEVSECVFGVARKSENCGNRRVFKIQQKIFAILVSFVFLFGESEALWIGSCDVPLGLSSGSLPDHAMKASSSHDLIVGPHRARLGVESGGGAWCPSGLVHEGMAEWLQIEFDEVRGFVGGAQHIGYQKSKNLHDPAEDFHNDFSGENLDKDDQEPPYLPSSYEDSDPPPSSAPSPPLITRIATQGRYANNLGVEYTTSYVIYYEGVTTNGELKMYTGSESTNQTVFEGNIDTFNTVTNDLVQPVAAWKLRIIPYSKQPRVVCLRVELYGCYTHDGVRSYTVEIRDPKDPYGPHALSYKTYAVGEGSLYDSSVPPIDEEGFLESEKGVTTVKRFHDEALKLKSSEDLRGFNHERTDALQSLSVPPPEAPTCAGELLTANYPLNMNFTFSQMRAFNVMNFYITLLRKGKEVPRLISHLGFGSNAYTWHEQTLDSSNIIGEHLGKTYNVSVNLRRRPASLLRISLTLPEGALVCVHEIYFDSVPCLCSLDDFRQPSSPESHRNPLSLPEEIEPTPTIAKVSRTSLYPLYIGVIVVISVGIGVLILVFVGIWIKRRQRKDESPRMFRKSNGSTIDMGYLVERVGVNSNVSQVGLEVGSVGSILEGKSGEHNGTVVITSNSGEHLGLTSIEDSGIGNTGTGVMLSCDDPRLPLVPSRSWGEFKMTGSKSRHDGVNMVGSTLTGRIAAKPVMSSRNSSNTLCTRNSAGNLLMGNRNGSNMSNRPNGNTITMGARPSASTMNISRHQSNSINNSKSTNNIMVYNHTGAMTVYHNNVNKSSGNILGIYNTIAPRNNRNSSSTMSTKSTDSSTISSNEGPSNINPFYIKPPTSFSSPGEPSYSTPNNEGYICTQSPSNSGGNFFSPDPFSQSSTPFTSNSCESPTFPEYSTLTTFDDNLSSSSGIYTTPTPTSNSNSIQRPLPTLPPPTLPARFHPPPPPTSSSNQRRGDSSSTYM